MNKRTPTLPCFAKFIFRTQTKIAEDDVLSNKKATDAYVISK